MVGGSRSVASLLALLLTVGAPLAAAGEGDTFSVRYDGATDTVTLSWPDDPDAVGYVVLVNGREVVLPADRTTFTHHDPGAATWYRVSTVLPGGGTGASHDALVAVTDPDDDPFRDLPPAFSGGGGPVQAETVSPLDGLFPCSIVAVPGSIPYVGMPQVDTACIPPVGPPAGPSTGGKVHVQT